jgi:hypothetical protein
VKECPQSTSNEVVIIQISRHHNKASDTHYRYPFLLNCRPLVLYRGPGKLDHGNLGHDPFWPSSPKSPDLHGYRAEKKRKIRDNEKEDYIRI